MDKKLLLWVEILRRKKIFQLSIYTKRAMTMKIIYSESGEDGQKCAF